MAGTLFLHDGSSVDGKLVVQAENPSNGVIKVYEGKSSKPMNFKLHQVTGYRIHEEHYFLKDKRGALRFGSAERSFMKRLTPEGSRIHLYEETAPVAQSGKASGVAISRAGYETEYYVQLPNESSNTVYALNSSRLVPDFNEKMSTVVADCPALASKIAAKADDYFYAQLSFSKEKRLQVLQKIIEEYNRCQ